MKKISFEVILNIVFWIVTAWMLTSNYSIEFHEIEIVNGVETVIFKRNSIIILQLISVVILALVMFYANIRNILKLKSKNRSVFLITGLILIATCLLVLLTRYFPYFNQYPPLPLTLSLGTVIFYFTISVSYGLVKVWQRSENMRQNALIEKKQAELKLLRSQLHPHFLFNTLNNLLSMVDQQKSPELTKAFERLSALLRYVVYEANEGKVAIKKEIEFIKNFGELQKLRFEKDEIDFRIDIKGDFDTLMIEPGIFIPFVENAFKYGVEPEKKSMIYIQFDLSKKSCLEFCITNPVFGKANGKNGSGIKSTKDRLELVYPDKHILNITQSDVFKVELKIRD